MSLTVTDLRCEYKTDPLGIDVAAPRLSWRLESTQRNRRQLAYQLTVASGEQMLWDTGRVESDRSTHIRYAGKPLTSHQKCRWRVRVWDGDDEASAWSGEAGWTMGLLSPNDWQAEWIASPESAGGRKKKRPDPYLPPCVYFRQEFVTARPIKWAVLYATALGLFEVRLNGHRVGEDYFTPGWTDYHRRVYYHTYDVTSFVRSGANALGAILAEGWYSGYVGVLLQRVAGMPTGRDRYGDTPHLRVHLRLEYDDGTVAEIGTGAKWKTATGPHREADILMGESYDARREMPGWDQPRFDAAGWKGALVRRDLKPETCVEAYPGVPVRAIQTLNGVRRSEPREGVHVFDLGQNFAGRVRLAVEGAAGRTIELRHAEMLHADGTLLTENLQAARATDRYTLKGGGREEWEPSFTYHGFRYVEVTGYPGTPPADAVTGVVLHSDTPLVGSFECSHPRINRLYQNIVWTQRANFFDIPTDCPQRDERLGWTGDAAAYIRSAAYNADVAVFFTKWLQDLEDSQRRTGAYPNYAPLLYQWKGKNVNSPAWADAGIICPYTLYRVYGDTRVIERHYESMKRYLAYQEAVSEGFLGPDEGFGDWLSVGEKTRKDLIATAYWAENARMMAEMATVLGQQADAQSYHRLYEHIRAMFQRVFVYGDARLRGNSQTSYALAINLGLLPEEMVPQAGRNLAERIEAKGGHLSTGFVGLKHLLPALARAGQIETAYHLLTDTGFPSWGYSIENGATTIWERWDSWTKEKGFKNSKMNSFCHYALGSVCEWLFSGIAGIDALEPGYRRILIRPRPGGGLTYAQATYRSLPGRIAVRWEQQPGAFVLQVEIPANATARVHVPAGEGEVREYVQHVDSSEGVFFQGKKDGEWLFEVGSGAYQFETR